MPPTLSILNLFNSRFGREFSCRNENLAKANNVTALSGEFAYPGRGSFPATACAKIYNNGTAADIHISCHIDEYIAGDESDYNIFRYDFIKALCQGKEVVWTTEATHVQLFNSNKNPVSDVYYGRTGLLMAVDALKRITFSRVYNASMDTGGWESSRTDIYQQDTYVVIDIYGATLS